MIGWAFAAVVALGGAPVGQAATPSAVLTDADLQRFVATPFDKRTMMFRSQMLGTHNGLPVLVSYPCSDLCPEYTTRIIRYDVPADRCDEVGGRLDNQFVPSGPGSLETALCKPPILVSAAGEFRPASTLQPCLPGFVARLASATDFVCVPPATRARSRRENALAESRRGPAGPQGVHGCLTGFVWREGFPDDLVCVTPWVRERVREENRLAPERRAPSRQ